MQTFARRNPKNGLIEVIDVETGKLVAVQKDVFDLFNGHRELFAEHVLPTGERVLMQKGVDASALAHSKGDVINQYMVDLICQQIAEGASVTTICKQDGYPSYATLCKWRRDHPGVNKQFEDAKKERAEYYRDQAVREAETAESTKDPINASALRVDTYKWAAGMDDTKYSPKSKVEATLNQPVQIVVHTGIQREEREVIHEQIKTEVAPALPNNTGVAAPAEPRNIRQEPEIEIHSIPISDPKSW